MEGNGNKWYKFVLACVICIGTIALLALAIQAIFN